MALHRHRPHLAIVGIAFALVLSGFVIDARAKTGVLTRTVEVDTEMFHLIAKYSPLKFVVPSPPASHGD